MSASPPARPRRTRADAERRRRAILEVAAGMLGRRPEPSVEDIAAATGVSRQTVYAHYPSRDALRAAAFDHAVAAALAAIDATPTGGPAVEALLRVLESSWRTLDRYPVLLDPPPERAAGGWEEHAPVVDRLLRLITRGQREGELDPDRPAEWLVGAVIALGHAAAEQVAAGLLTPDRVAAELAVAVRRLVAPPGLGN